MVMKMERLLNPWLEEEGSDGNGKESDIVELSDQSQVAVTRSSFMSWFATKATSIFLGLKEEYIQELENLLPEEEYEDFAVLFKTDRTTNFSIMVSDNRFRKINEDLMIWWINKAASIFVRERDCTQQSVNPLPEDDDVVVSLGTESGVNMVGSTDLFCKIRDDLLEDFEELKFSVISGMVGIGKTALAKKIIKDPLISSKFELCIFVRIGPESQRKEILEAILAQMLDGDKMLMKDDVSHSLYETLKMRKCLLVLDDFWDRGTQNISDTFPQGSSQSAILFTTRINYGTTRLPFVFKYYQVSLLNKEESWDLLRGKIFGEKRCLPQLEKAGRTIAENCEDLPLLIVTVAGLLSEAEKTPEYWSKVAANKTNSIFIDAYEQVYDVVYPSYYYLPQRLKACFLYLEAFPQNDEVRMSRLISLWSADGFLGVPYTFLQEHAYKLLKEIVFYNVALVTQRSTRDLQRIKDVSLHSVFWYLSKREARKEKLFHVMNSYTDASEQGIKDQRRLSIYKNILLSIKYVRDSIASISALHSLLCTGPYHQYEVPICLGKLRFLKVLDALTIRLYEFK